MNIPSSIKAAIFDMDGLMIDSEPYWAQADKAFFEKYGKPYSSEVNVKIMGMGQREIMEFFKKEYGFIGETGALIKERKKLLYKFLLADVKLMEGIEELIHALYKEEIILAIATSGHTVEKAQEILAKFKLQDYFSLAVSGDDVEKSKPAPDIYLKTAELLYVQPSVCLVFEDAPKGVQAAKAAGMTVFAVNKDPELYQKVKEAGADEVFKSLTEILV
ncbi:MAG TPA: HAD family phosphatase [Candidatus Saccharimonadales bacterium]|nr:HAD family phosphatase [Candidatus Saccharimonadales bacterium]